MGEKMTINWVEFFNLRGNPFSTSPLEGEFELSNLLVRTKSIRDQVLPIAKFIGISAPSIKILLGARGAGKSTCLSCLRQLVQGNPNVLSVNFLPRFGKAAIELCNDELARQEIINDYLDRGIDLTQYINGVDNNGK